MAPIDRIQDAVQNAADSLAQAGQATAFDSIWAGSDIPTQAPSGLENVMLSNDKIFVVLVVVLIIWSGIMFMLWRNDNRISELERQVGDQSNDLL